MAIKQTLPLFLIASFLGIAVFGVFAMHIHDDHGSVCIAALSNGQPCLDSRDVFASLIFHLNVFKSFSTAVFAGSIFAALFLLLTFLSLPMVSLALGRQQAQQAWILPEKPFFPAQLRFTGWLALKENSPNFF